MLDPQLVPDRLLRVYPDFEESPLLGVDPMRPLTGADLGLSAGLTTRIEAWHSLFETEHTGGRQEWSSAEARDRYAAEAHAIIEALVAELPGFVIRYNLWPVADPGGYAGRWAEGWSPSGEKPLPAGTPVRQFDVAPERWIRLMNDYSGPPLWATYGGVASESLGLPEDLCGELSAWQDEFDSGFHWETGWRTDDLAAAHVTEGRRLLPLIAAELPGHVVELKAGGTRAYAGAWVDGWLPVLPDVAYGAAAE